jgi:hypothetical protein
VACRPLPAIARRTDCGKLSAALQEAIERKAKNPTKSLLKAVTHLLHQNGFSIARGYLLRVSASILQDDSGIPLHYCSSENGLYASLVPTPDQSICSKASTNQTFASIME